jgi:hypothetical protein
VASARKILSIASAPGWSALFEALEEQLGEERVVTLAAWALVEEPGDMRRVVGLVQRGHSEEGDDGPGALALADEINGFVGYAHRGVRMNPDS